MVITGDVMRHRDCGALVVMPGAYLLDLDGREHLCRDYLSWYGPPDRRDPLVVDVPDGWRPVYVLVRVA